MSVLPEYFENYYARIGREPGSFFALALTNGAVLETGSIPLEALERHIDAWIARKK